MSDHKIAEALRHIRNHTSVNSHQIEIIDEALAAHEAEQQAGEAVAWLVIDSTGQPMHAAGWEAAAHEHINDAISEYDLREAAEWRVVPVYAHPQQPLTGRERELLDGLIERELHHAAQCDGIANRRMAEKQKGWDMERVALLRKLAGITKDTK